MVIWLGIILLMGLTLLFGSEYVVNNDLMVPIGIVISFICVGMGIRMQALRRRGSREKLSDRVKELEAKIKELTEGEKT